MAKAVKIDIKEFKEFQRRIEEFQKEIDFICSSLAKEIALRLLRKVKFNTPVKSGNLRRSWAISEVVKNENFYTVEVINPLEYASYVEYGHRKRNHKGWVEGKFMLTVSEKEINNNLEKIVKGKLKKIFEEKFK